MDIFWFLKIAFNFHEFLSLLFLFLILFIPFHFSLWLTCLERARLMFTSLYMRWTCSMSPPCCNTPREAVQNVMPCRGAGLYWKSCDSSFWLIPLWLQATGMTSVCEPSPWTFLLAGCEVTFTTTCARCLPTPAALMYRLSAKHFFSLMLMLLGARRKVVLILVTDWHERHNSAVNVKPNHLIAPYWLAAVEPINPQWRRFKAGFRCCLDAGTLLTIRQICVWGGLKTINVHYMDDLLNSLNTPIFPGGSQSFCMLISNTISSFIGNTVLSFWNGWIWFHI